MAAYFGVWILEKLGEYLAEALDLLSAKDAVRLHHILEVDEAVASVRPLRARQTRDGFVHVLVAEQEREREIERKKSKIRRGEAKRDETKRKSGKDNEAASRAGLSAGKGRV